MTIEDEKKVIDFEVYKFNERMKKQNKKFTHIQVTEVKVKINQPSRVDAKLWFQFLK